MSTDHNKVYRAWVYRNTTIGPLITTGARAGCFGCLRTAKTARTNHLRSWKGNGTDHVEIWEYHVPDPGSIILDRPSPLPKKVFPE